jgi:type 1 fimbria pilin
MTSIRKTLIALAASLLLGSSMAAHADTTTQNISLTGTISPPSASCLFGSAPTINFNGTVPPVAASWVHANTSISLTCTSGTPYTLSAPIAWTPVTVGGVAAGVSLSDAGNDLYYHPKSGTGTGAVQNIALHGILGGAAAWSSPDVTKHVGQVSGTVQLSVAY